MGEGVDPPGSMSTGTAGSGTPAADRETYRGKRLLIAGGGTGGHIYPGIAVAEEWTARGGDVAFAGVQGNLEAKVIPEANYRFLPLEVQGFSRGKSLQSRLKALRAGLFLLTLSPLRQAMAVLREFRPDVVLGSGGYVSGPTLLAARLAGIPTMILQIDAHPGLANRIAGQFVTCIGIAMPEVAVLFRRKDRVRLVGNPIRSNILTTTREEGLEAFGLHPGRRTLLIFGGSLGSRPLNEAAVGALEILGREPGWGARHQVIHITGSANPIRLDQETARALGLIYIPVEYCNRMELALAAADLAICRCGATTIAELTARGLAAILIPWAGAADNHQESNARTLERRGAARVILDRELSATSLAAAASKILSHPGAIQDMAAASLQGGIPDAASRVARELGILTGE